MSAFQSPFDTISSVRTGVDTGVGIGSKFLFILCIGTHQVSHLSGKNFSASGNILGSQLAALVRNPT